MKSKIILFIIFTTSLIFYCYEFYLRALPNAFSTEIMHYFHLDNTENEFLSFSLLISSYNITYLILQIPAGFLLDRYGNRKVLIPAILVAGAGNCLFICDSFTISIIGRILVGAGSAFGFIGVLKICRDYISPKYFPVLASIVISVGTLAAAYSEQLALSLGSGNVFWQSIFWTSGLFAIPLSIMIFLVFNKKLLNLTKIHTIPEKTITIKSAIYQMIELIKNKKIVIIALIGGLLYAPTVVLKHNLESIFLRTVTI